jgi:hypothetical protein
MNTTGYKRATDGSIRYNLDNLEPISIPADGRFAVLIDNDVTTSGTGTILKHGPAEIVVAAHRRYWAALHHTSLEFAREIAQNLTVIEVPVAAMNDEVVAEINGYLNTTGTADRLRQRLESLDLNDAQIALLAQKKAT